MPKISDWLNRVCEIALIVILSAMAIVVFMQVLFRYVLHLPLFWTEEFARYCLVWASLLGAAIALKRQEHIAVTFFLEHFPIKFRGLMTLVGRISVALILGVMTWGGVKLVWITSAQISPALRIPMAIPYLALPIGSAVMLFHMISFIIYRPVETAAKDPDIP